MVGFRAPTVRAVFVSVLVVAAGLGVALFVAVPGANGSASRSTASAGLQPAATEYTITFTETGLPSGTLWLVNLTGTIENSTTASIAFSEVPGSYAYNVTAPLGFSASPSTGTAKVTDAAVNVPVTMTAAEGGDAVLELYTIYNSRPDLQSAFPYAWTNLSSYGALIQWAGYVVINQTVDSAQAQLEPYAAWYVLLSVYNSRSDLQAAFPSAFTDFLNYTELVTWAGQVVEGQYPDSANMTLAPFAAWYALMATYNNRADLLATFPDAYSNATSYDALVNWAGGVVTGQFTDSASGTLDHFGSYYALMMVYDGRTDLQASFPNAYQNWTSYWGLVDWAGEVTTSQISDGAYSTLHPFGYFYALAWVYSQRSDLQAAFPSAGTNGAAYASLIGWAKEVVEGKITDPAYAYLSPFASFYESYVIPSFATTVDFTVSGLPSGTSWILETVFVGNGPLFFSVGTLVISNGASLQLTMLDGSYIAFVEPYLPSSVSPFNYTSDYVETLLTLSGAYTVVPSSFTTQTTYPIVFHESGLPSGATWSLSLENVDTGATETTPFVTSSVTVYAAAGDYEATTEEVQSITHGAIEDQYQTPETPLTVTGAASKTLTFTKDPVWSVNFTETGLPSGSEWNVSLGDLSANTTGTVLEFSYGFAGNYSFSVVQSESSGQYQATPASGYVNCEQLESGGYCSPAVSNVPITFSTISVYTVTFTETGLSSGTLWGAFLAGTPGDFVEESSSASVTLDVPAGTYLWIVGVAAGGAYLCGAVVVTSAGAAVPVDFSDASAGIVDVILEGNGIPGPNWTATVNGVAVTTNSFFVLFGGPLGASSFNYTAPAGQLALVGSGTFSIASSPTYTLGAGVSTLLETYCVPLDDTTSFSFGPWGGL